MNLTLKRTDYRPDGIFGELLDEAGERVMITLEHAYLDATDPSAVPCPKVPAGPYTCRRGMHRLHPESPEFETFEITGVPGHTGILFHCGNLNMDSQGCVLVGERIERDPSGLAPWHIMESRRSHEALMALQAGVGEFALEVT